MAPNQAFRCSTCSQTFARNEHLQRHQATHYSYSRPFQCSFCPDTFTRSDVLKRHESTHRRFLVDETSDSGQPGQGQVARPRPRTSVACDNCAKGKIRCNGVRPCERCKTRSLECTLQRPHTGLKRRMPPPSTAEVTDLRTERAMAYGDFDISNSVEGTQQQRVLPHAEVSIVGTVSAVPEAPMSLPTGDAQGLPTQNDAHPSQYQQQLSDNVGFIQSSAGIGVGIVDSGGPPDFGGNNQSYELPETDMYLGFDVMNPSAVFDFPSDLWFQDPSPEVTPSPASAPALKDGASKPVKDSKSFGMNTHANSPFFHVLDSNASLSLKVNLICDFLNNEACWKQISENADKVWKNDKQPEPIINPQIRDALLAVTYVILSGRLEALPQTLSFRFPPLETIQCLFNSCFSQFLRMYPFIHPSSFDIVTQTSETSITYPLFLQNIMIMGALLVPNKESRAFAIELAYVTRRAMHDTVIKDALTTDDVWMLSATILITAFGAWSGNKKHMEIAEGYRGSYTVMFNRRGYLRPTRRQEGDDELANDWRHWISRERKRRLFHVWYIFEQEISMLNCIPSHVYFTDMRGTMPGPDAEYFANSESEWRQIRDNREKTTQQSTKVQPPSLAALYWLFLRDDFLHLDVEITPLQLRLLQCAIQTQVIQYAQTARFVNVENILPGGILHNVTTSHSTTFAQLRHEELQGLLVRWYVLRKRVLTPSTSPDLAMACTLMYHLASMELYICFDDVQLLAGKHGLAAGRDILPHFQRWARSPASMKAIAHAGQVVRTLQKQFVNQAGDFLFPLWWPVAVSRVALLFWSYAVTDAVLKRDNAEQEEVVTRRDQMISVNDAIGELGPHGKVIQHNEGVPCLTDFEGVLVPLDQIADVVTISLEILEKGMARSTPLCDGVHQFLQDIRRCGNPY